MYVFTALQCKFDTKPVWNQFFLFVYRIITCSQYSPTFPPLGRFVYFLTPFSLIFIQAMRAVAAFAPGNAAH